MSPVEAVARAIAANCEQYEETYERAARAAIEALAANVTDEMYVAFAEAFEDPKLPDNTTHEQAVKLGLAAALRAALSDGQKGTTDE